MLNYNLTARLTRTYLLSVGGKTGGKKQNAISFTY